MVKKFTENGSGGDSVGTIIETVRSKSEAGNILLECDGSLLMQGVYPELEAELTHGDVFSGIGDQYNPRGTTIPLMHASDIRAKESGNVITSGSYSTASYAGVLTDSIYQELNDSTYGVYSAEMSADAQKRIYVLWRKSDDYLFLRYTTSGQSLSASSARYITPGQTGSAAYATVLLAEDEDEFLFLVRTTSRLNAYNGLISNSASVSLITTTSVDAGAIYGHWATGDLTEIYVCGNGGLLVTKDKGVVFISKGVLPNGKFAYKIQRTTTGRLIVIDSLYGIWESDDDGDTWRRNSISTSDQTYSQIKWAGIKATASGKLYAIATGYRSNGNVNRLTDLVFAYSPDNGESWTYSIESESSYPPTTFIDLHCVKGETEIIYGSGGTTIQNSAIWPCSFPLASGIPLPNISGKKIVADSI